MDNSSFNASSVQGFVCTILLFVFSKITSGYMLFSYIKISDVASAATILSGTVVVLVNLPKVINVYHQYLKPKRRKK